MTLLEAAERLVDLLRQMPYTQVKISNLEWGKEDYLLFDSGKIHMYVDGKRVKRTHITDAELGNTLWTFEIV